MKGDFSRWTFDPLKHYRSVRMQQGRVQLDADWNESLDILLRRIETEALDVIGACGVPIHDAGFGVVTEFKSPPLSQEETDWLTAQGFDTLGKGDFYLTQGRAYVDGIQIENDNTLPFSQQPFVLPKGQAQTGADGVYLLYLDVWERHITVIEDPDIREVALGGPDTATRTQIIWQARLASVSSDATCADDLAPWPAPSTGQLSARTQPEDQPDDPCTVPPSAGYKRLENQLYRVEIHQGGVAGKSTFKWSRDNGSVVVSVAEFIVENNSISQIQTTSLGRDDVLGLHENDWIEVLDDAAELAGTPGTLVQITKIDHDNILTITPSISGSTYDPNGHPKVRRWDVNSTQTAAEIAVTEGAYLALEGGVEVQFETGATYRTGDYWLIPARTVPGQYGDIEWPQVNGSPAALLPFGIAHHYCQLALLTFSGSVVTNVEDCRNKFPPLTELPTGGDRCCSVTVGQNGDYPDLPSAIAARPPDADWWTVCVLPGILSLKDTLALDKAQSLTLSGCGNQCRVIGPSGKPLFNFTNGQNLKLEGLQLEASSPDGAVLFSDTQGITFTNCTASNKDSSGKQAAAPLLIINNGNQVEVYENTLLGLPAVIANGNSLSIRRNQITGGGIQITPFSSTVQIEDNIIIGGQGPGIRLGGESAVTETWQEMTDTPKTGDQSETKSQNPLTGIQGVQINHNQIVLMTGSGIITATTLGDSDQVSDVESLTISGNQILACCQTPEVTLSPKTRVGGGIAIIGLFSAQITDNLIIGNGQGKTPACGIFVLDGGAIDIDRNLIAENGVAENSAELDSYQAGIAAQFMFGNFIGASDSASGLAGYPAMRIRDNEVVCPAGQALSIAVAGDVMIAGNTFVSRERLKQPTDPLNFSEKGACISVLDLGLPVWFPDLGGLLQMAAGGQANLHLEDFTKAEASYAAFPTGRVLFHNNQVTFSTQQEDEVKSLPEKITDAWVKQVWEAVFFSALFFSLDDVSLSDNQFQASVPPYALKGLEDKDNVMAYLLKFMHVAGVATTLRATGNGLTEQFFSNSISYLSNATAMNVTTSNEATHAFSTNAPKKVEANNLSLTP